jgi:hypothetical protein
VRNIKFRAWGHLVGEDYKMHHDIDLHWNGRHFIPFVEDDVICDHSLIQYTGLKDSKGVEIYELMQIDQSWEVNHSNGNYVLINISSGDIIDLYKYMDKKDGKITITKEYTKI